MRIGEIIKEKQPKESKHINKMREKKLTERDIEELMYHSSYKRGSKGAIKQVR